MAYCLLLIVALCSFIQNTLLFQKIDVEIPVVIWIFLFCFTAFLWFFLFAEKTGLESYNWKKKSAKFPSAFICLRHVGITISTNIPSLVVLVSPSLAFLNILFALFPAFKRKIFLCSSQTSTLRSHGSNEQQFKACNIIIVACSSILRLNTPFCWNCHLINSFDSMFVTNREGHNPRTNQNNFFRKHPQTFPAVC